MKYVYIIIIALVCSLVLHSQSFNSGPNNGSQFSIIPQANTNGGSGTGNGFPLTADANANGFSITNINNLGITGVLTITNIDGLTQTPFSIIGATNNYYQFFLQNLSSGIHASTDFVMGNDQSSPTSISNFFNISYNSSGYTDNIFGGRSDLGMFTAPGCSNIIFGLQQTNGTLHIRVGGAIAANDILNITSNSIAGQSGIPFSGNGSGLTNLNASNITGGTTNGFTVIFTNLALNTVYTNTFSTPILVSGITPVFTTALVAGRCTMNFSITNSGVATNITPSQVTVGLIGSATGTMTNATISFMLTNGGTFAITDTSSGAGNSVSISGNPSFSYVQQIAIANNFVGNGGGLTNLVQGFSTSSTATSLTANQVKYFALPPSTIAISSTEAPMGILIPFQAPFIITNLTGIMIGAIPTTTNVMYRIYTNGVVAVAFNLQVSGNGSAFAAASDTTDFILMGGTAWTNRFSMQISNMTAASTGSFSPGWSFQIVK